MEWRFYQEPSESRRRFREEDYAPRKRQRTEEELEGIIGGKRGRDGDDDFFPFEKRRI